MPSTINDVDKYAYGENIGWINLRPDQAESPQGIVVGERFLCGLAYSANCGWISFGNGSPIDGVDYSNDSADDFGVNLDESGNLSGYAYGENIGWINFGWADVSDEKRPRIDPQTGVFYGFAYSANVGWISLGAGYLANDTIAADIDEDGIADDWEYVWMGNLIAADSESDRDGDGTKDRLEALAQTDPENPNDALKILDFSVNALKGEAELAFSSKEGVAYRIEISESLNTWTDCGIGSFESSEGSITTKSFVWPVGQRRFVRVAVVLE